MSITKTISRTIVTAPTPLRLGEFCEQYGGHFAGMMQGAKNEPDYYLFVPGGAAAEIVAEFGGYGEDEPGAMDPRDGRKNTLALCASVHQHPAAKFAHEFKAHGLDDYYLPSQAELMLCFANCPDIFAKEWYWSSTQRSADYAWVQSVGSGSADYSYKRIKCRVRPVRRLVIHPL